MRDSGEVVVFDFIEIEKRDLGSEKPITFIPFQISSGSYELLLSEVRFFDLWKELHRSKELEQHS